MATPIGKKAFFISDRSGFRFPLDQRVKEPGTEFIVAKSESDGIFNLGFIIAAAIVATMVYFIFKYNRSSVP